jgi:hypothetical protein
MVPNPVVVAAALAGDENCPDDANDNGEDPMPA